MSKLTGITGDDSEHEQPNNRWWENYLARYLVGTGYGVICLLLVEGKHHLFSQNLSYFSLSESQDSALKWIVLLSAGFTSCYISSGILMFTHFTRGAVRSRSVNALLALSLNALALPLYYFEFTKGLGAIIPLLVLLFTQGGYYLWVRIFKDGGAFEYYKKLAEKRTLANRGYVESYRHLREHGNAYMIVLTQTIMFAYIEASLTRCDQGLSEVKLVLFGMAFVVHSFAPSMMMSFGQDLEKSMVNESYIDERKADNEIASKWVGDKFVQIIALLKKPASTLRPLWCMLFVVLYIPVLLIALIHELTGWIERLLQPNKR